MSNWVLRTNDFKFFPFAGESIACTKNDLVLQSLKKLSLFWGIGFLCVFIPMLHFFLVPGFIIAGIYSFLKQYKNTHHLLAGSFRCPSCDETSEVKNLYFHEDSKISCSNCARQLTIKAHPA